MTGDRLLQPGDPKSVIEITINGVPVDSGWSYHGSHGAIVFDSCKQAKYVAAATSAKIYVGEPETCLDAAVTGRWRDD